MALLSSAARAEIRSKIDDKRRARKEETHLLIQRAAENIALTQGRAALTTKTLVAEAGVSERTIFNHFPNIEAVLLSCLGLHLTKIVNPQNFPRVASKEDLPQAIEDFILTVLADEKTDEPLQEFVNLAITFTNEDDLGDTLGRDIFQTLTDMSWSLCTEILERHTDLSRGQETQIMLYLHNIFSSFAYGMGRYLYMNEEVLQESIENYTLAGLRDSMAWSVRQVGMGRPDLRAE